MSQDETLAEAAKTLGVGSVLPEVYKDLFSPAARELGKGLVTVAKAVRVGLAPLDGMVWGYERIREWLSIRVTDILAERGVREVKSAPISVAGPLLLQMVFASEEPDLREMYARLMATAMDSQREKEAHPSFVSVIHQISPSEARILRHIGTMDEKWPNWSGNQESLELQEKMRNLCSVAGVTDWELADVSIENLTRLGLFRHFTAVDAEYRPEGANDHSIYGPSVSANNTEIIEVTSFGRAFLKACIQ